METISVRDAWTLWNIVTFGGLFILIVWSAQVEFGSRAVKVAWCAYLIWTVPILLRVLGMVIAS